MKKNKDLFPRQQDYLDQVLKGKSNQEIADHYGVSLGTVKNTMTKIYKKLGYTSRSEMIVDMLK